MGSPEEQSREREAVSTGLGGVAVVTKAYLT